MAEPNDDLARTASRLWSGVLDALRLRVELAALELGAERRRFEQLVLSALVTVLALFMLVLALNVALLAVFWDTHRVAAAVASCVLWALLAAGSALFHRWRGRRQAPPFAGISAVLADDERALRELL
jgi:uncharacterized membrane protein YqjE